jgi:GNAT superfamily N-acetyltransferase
MSDRAGLERQTHDMQFRMATPADVGALANLRWTWRVDEQSEVELTESREAFVARFSLFAVDALAGRWTAWIAEDDDQVVANIWTYRVPKVPSPGRNTRDFGYMTNVYTIPAMRDRGVGSKLLAEVKAWAHDSDLELIVVWPSERSVPWYTRAGYSPSVELLELEIAGYEG